MVLIDNLLNPTWWLVLRIRDVYPGSKIYHTGSRVEKIPDRHQRILLFLTQKIFTKLPEIWSRMFIPDPDFFHPESRGHKSTGSRTRNTDGDMERSNYWKQLSLLLWGRASGGHSSSRRSRNLCTSLCSPPQPLSGGLCCPPSGPMRPFLSPEHHKIW
jgi:hypothetical protein